jgi:HEAT repeat protein
MLVLVACCAAIAWAGRVVWESVPSNRMTSLLRSGSAESRRLAARDLAAASTDELDVAIPALIDALDDADREVAEEAARGLGIDVLTAQRVHKLSGVNSAFDALARALADGRAEVRTAAIRSLGLIGNAVAVAPPPALVRILAEDPSDQMRALAANALGSFHTDIDDAVAPLLDALACGPFDVKSACNFALSARAFKPSSKLVPYLIGKLEKKGGDVRVRYRSASLLGRVGPDAREAIPSLIAAAQEPLATAPDPLPKLGGGEAGGGGMALAPRAMGTAPPQETPEDWDPAVQAALALGRIAHGTGSAPAIATLLAGLLNSEHDWRCESAARGLNEMERDALPATGALTARLTEIATGRRKASGWESWITMAIGRAAPGSPAEPEAIKALSVALDADDPGIRRLAAAALGSFGPAASASIPRLRALAGKADREVAPAAKRALRSIESKAKSKPDPRPD